MSIYAQADAEFWAQHPELNGRQLTMGPEDKYYRQEYMKVLRRLQQEQSGSDQSTAAPSSQPVCGTNPEPPPPTNPEKSIKCNAKSLKVSKGGNDFVLTIPGTNVEFNKQSFANCRILEIVAGPPANPVEISVNVQGLVGPCPDSHQGTAFGVVQGDYQSPSVSDEKFSGKVSFREIPDGNTFKAYTELLRLCWGDNHVAYDINYQTCGFSENCRVMVYPQLSLKASASLEYEWEWTKKGEIMEREDDKGGNDFRDNLKLDLNAEYAGKSVLSVKQGTVKKEADEEPKLITFLDEFFQNLDYLRSGFGCFFRNSQKLTLGFSPKLEVSAGLAEVPGKPFVDKEYTIDVGFDPLFSISGEADVSGGLILSIPVIGQFLMAAIEAAESVDAADVFIGFIVDGELKLTGTIKQDAGGAVTSSLAMSGAIKIKLEAHVKAEGTVFFFSYSFGVKAGAASGITAEVSGLTEDSQGMYVPIEIKFLGIIVYKQTWHSVGMSSESDTIPEFTDESDISGIGQNETEDVDDLKDTDKKVLLEPSSLYSGRFNILGG